MYTFVIRSADRVYEEHADRPTSDFRVRLPFMPELAKHDYWKVSIARAVFPMSTAYNTHFDDGTDEYTQPSSQLVYTQEFLEVRLEFGSACKGHDTATGGGRFVHYVTCDAFPSAQQRMASTQAEAIAYEIARPSLNELRVQVVNRDGFLAGFMTNDDFPSAQATQVNAMYALETALPDWTMVLHVEPIKKNVYA